MKILLIVLVCATLVLACTEGKSVLLFVFYYDFKQMEAIFVH